MAKHSPGQVHDLFTAALQQPPHARAAFLAEACNGNTALLREVRELLDDYGERNMPAGERQSADGYIGSCIGPYRILRLLGAGGMGRVYLATRADGAFERTVAIKVMGSQTESAPGDLVERFEAEGRLLASLQHPNIAALLDAGRAADGRLYFVLEYVDGLPITAYCERYVHSVKGRVRLFLQVCDAVAIAHNNLIVHRDLKPGNILVNADGVPKLLDFGIAKTITRAGLEASDRTVPLLRRASPAYASPEQLSGGTAHTGMDVFALGVILFELLAGIRPRRSSSDETTTTDVAAVPPSAAALTGGARSLAPEIDADLDAVVLKAMDQDAAARYSSVEPLSQDLRAWLVGYPVRARAASAWHSARKFFGRNRARVTLAAVILLVAVSGMVLTARLWQAAERERAIAAERFDASHAFAATLFDVDTSSRRDARHDGRTRGPCAIAGRLSPAPTVAGVRRRAAPDGYRGELPTPGRRARQPEYRKSWQPRGGALKLS